MGYAVELTRRAARDLNDLFEYLDASNSSSARRWFNGLEKAISSLGQFPRRCPRATESRRAVHLIRHLLFGKKPDIYRVLYEIEELAKTVRVLSIRHGAREE